MCQDKQNKDGKMSQGTQNKCEKLSKIVKWALGSFIVITLINIGICNLYVSKIAKIEKNYATTHNETMTAIEKAHPEIKGTIKPLPQTQENFMEEYYSVQSDYLNKGLTILTIILGVLAIAFPIMFADKRKDISDIIEKSNENFESIKKKAEECICKLDTIELDKKIAKIEEDMKQIKEWKEATETDAKKSKINRYLAVGNARLSKDDFVQAIDSFRKVISLDEKILSAHYSLGMSLYYFEKYPEAVQAFKERDRLNLKRTTEEETSFLCWEGLSYKAIKEYALAEDAYQKIIAQNPAYIKAYNNLASLYLDQNDADKTIEICLKGININKDFSLIYYNLTGGYILKNRIKEALMNMQKYTRKQKNAFIDPQDREDWLSKLQSSEKSSEREELISIIRQLPGRTNSGPVVQEELSACVSTC